MKARRVVIQNANDFAIVVVKVVPNITVIFVLQSDINKNKINWNLAKNVPGFKKAHIIKSSDDNIRLFTSQKNLVSITHGVYYCEKSEQCLKSAQPLQKISFINKYFTRYICISKNT